MIAKLVVPGTEVVLGVIICSSNGYVPSKGDCVSVGWFPMNGRCRIGALSGGP
jgi:hypothetical protein